MPTYLFICKPCANEFTVHDYQHNLCDLCGQPAQRNWKGEGANVATASLKAERERR